jgi:hypothetical protein
MLALLRAFYWKNVANVLIKQNEPAFVLIALLKYSWALIKENKCEKYFTAHTNVIGNLHFLFCLF